MTIMVVQSLNYHFMSHLPKTSAIKPNTFVHSSSFIKMSLRVVLLALVLGITSNTGERVTCRQSGPEGRFDCVSPVSKSDLSAQHQYVLWLQPKTSGKDQSLSIDVPNYQITDTIQAAAKGGSGKSHTSINLNLAKPGLSYLAQKEESVGEHSSSFDVFLNYDKLKGHSAHFADEGAGSQRYAPLHEKIQDPSGSSSNNFYTTVVNKTNTAVTIPCRQGFGSSFFTQVGFKVEQDYSIDETTRDLIDLVEYIRTAYSAIGVVTTIDNPVIGGRITNLLNRAMQDIERILQDYIATSRRSNRRKRQAAGTIDKVRSAASAAGAGSNAAAGGSGAATKSVVGGVNSNVGSTIDKARAKAAGGDGGP